MITFFTSLLAIFVLNFNIASLFFEAKVLSFYDQGRILGVEASLEENLQTLPVNADIPPGPQLKDDAPELDLSSASSAIAIDLETGKILFSKNAEQESAIASMTKLMTALIFLENNPGWDEIYTIKEEDRREGGRIYLFTGEEIKVKDLFYSSLVASDNVATIGLVGATGLPLDEFIKKMNEKAEGMGLKHTRFFDPVGLNDNNVSNVLEIAKFANEALSHEEIKEATLTKYYKFKTLQGRNKIVYNTDNLLSIFPHNGIEIEGGKTGFTEAAGYCFVGKFLSEGREIISVVLNAGDNDARFNETYELVDWVFGNYVWN